MQKIQESFQNINVPFGERNSFAVAYVISFGTFVSMFKYLNPSLKTGFIKKYSKWLKNKDDYLLLYKYLLCLRALRNRCAHGSHIVSNSFVNQLNQYSFITKQENTGEKYFGYSVFELTLKYLINSIYCKEEFKERLLKLLNKYRSVYSQYGGRQSINPLIIERIRK